MKAAAALCVTLLAAGAIAASSESYSNASPFYFVPIKVMELQLVIGTAVNESYCTPAPLPGHFCGGPLVHKQLDPFGGTSRSGKYNFHADGFLPPGLVLRSNGLLTGTVSPTFNYKSNTWNFKVCVSDEHIAPAPGDSDTTCKPASITLVNPYDGTWSGALTGTLTITNTQNGPAQKEVDPVDDPFSGEIKDGATSTLSDVATTISRSTSSAGQATLTLSISGDLPACEFVVKFTKNGTADNVAPLTCQSGAGTGYLEVFSDGAIHLKRTSSGP